MPGTGSGGQRRRLSAGYPAAHRYRTGSPDRRRPARRPRLRESSRRAGPAHGGLSGAYWTPENPSTNNPGAARRAVRPGPGGAQARPRGRPGIELDQLARQDPVALQQDGVQARRASSSAATARAATNGPRPPGIDRRGGCGASRQTAAQLRPAQRSWRSARPNGSKRSFVTSPAHQFAQGPPQARRLRRGPAPGRSRSWPTRPARSSRTCRSSADRPRRGGASPREIAGNRATKARRALAGARQSQEPVASSSSSQAGR